MSKYLIKTKSGEEIDRVQFIVKFLNVYFEQYHFHDYEYPKRGIELIESRLNFYLATKEKIEFLLEKYKLLIPEDDDELRFFNLYLGKGLIEWNNYVEYELNRSADFIDVFYEGIKPFTNCEENLTSYKKMYSFYNFYMSLKNSSEFNSLVDFFDIWSKFSRLNFQINWVNNEIKILKSKNRGSKIYLKNLMDEKIYKKLIEKGLEKNFFRRADSGFELIIPEPYKNSEKIYACSLGLYLKNMMYIHEEDEDKIVRALNHTFNLKLSKQNKNTANSSTKLNGYFNHWSNMFKNP